MKKNYEHLKEVDLYVDGGVIEKNPSSIGGTYACVLVRPDVDQEVKRLSGRLSPDAVSADVVTNNQTELWAVIFGMQYAKRNGYVVKHIISDSQVTLGRLYKNWKLNNIPDWMVQEFRSLLYDIHKTEGVHVKGHNGHKWNELCDRLCREQAELLSSKS